ncbi:hypothetical protein ACWJKU_19635 (plasmid) [Methylocaldum sp. MU1018]
MDIKTAVILGSATAYVFGFGSGFAVRYFTVPAVDVAKPPHSLAELKSNEAMTNAEDKNCEQGQYDGEPWKFDYCSVTMGQAKKAHYLARSMKAADKLINGSK